MTTARTMYRQAMEMLQRYLFGESDSDAAQLNLLAVEQFIVSKSHCLTQRSMTDFITVQRTI